MVLLAGRTGLLYHRPTLELFLAGVCRHCCWTMEGTNNRQHRTTLVREHVHGRDPGTSSYPRNGVEQLGTLETQPNLAPPTSLLCLPPSFVDTTDLHCLLWGICISISLRRDRMKMLSLPERIVLHIRLCGKGLVLLDTLIGE